MDKDNKLDIDNQIKDMFSEDIDIPEIVNSKSEEAYSIIRNLNNSKEVKRKGKSKFKYISVSTAASLAVICGIGIYNPSLANGVPLLQNLFSDLNQKLGIGDQYSQDSKSVQMESSSKGITVTIAESIFDGKNLYLTMELKSTTDKSLPVINKSIGDDGSYQYTLYDDVVDLDFKGEMHNINGIVGYFKDDKTFVGVSHYILESDKEVPESFNINLNLGSLGDVDMDPDDFVNGNWKFAFEVNSTDNVKTLKPNLSNGKYKIHEVKVSPYGVILDYSMPASFVNIKDGFERIVVYDDKGNELGIHEYNVRDFNFKNSDEIINEEFVTYLDIRQNIDLRNAKYLLVKFEDGKNVMVDDTVTVSDDGSTTEGPSYKGVTLPETKDIEFKINLN